MSNNNTQQTKPRNDNANILQEVKTEAQVCNNALNELTRLLNSTQISKKSAVESNFINEVTGKSQVMEIKRLATDSFEYYTKLVDQYINAKSEIIALSSDYVSLRGQIVDLHRKYSNMLIDLFGDSIKVVAPNLFDFDKIEWLDVGAMCKKVELDYYALDKSCTTLLGEISDGVRSSINKSFDIVRTTRSKSNAAIGVGLILLDRYLDTADNTISLEREYTLFKSKMTADKARIVADSGRLNVIYKTINDLYIPQANGFFRYGDEVLSIEIQKLFNAIYSTKELKQLKSDRDSLFEKLKIESNSIDHYNIEIEVYSSEIKNGRKSIVDNRGAYNKAISNRPNKPSALLNILSFGYLQSSYERNYYTWYEVYGNSIIEYQKLIKEVEAAKEKLGVLQTELEKCVQKYQEIELSIDKINRNIRSGIKADKDIQIAILPHLKSMISLLQSAKAIAENKLDDKIIRRSKISIDNNNAQTLTQIINDGIDQFTECLRDTLIQERKEIEDMNRECQKEKTQDQSSIEINDDYDEISDENLDMCFDVSLKAVNVFSNLAKLEALRIQNKYDEMLYQEELAKLQKELQGYFVNIDNKSAALKDILKKMNTSNDISDIKNGLISLGLVKDENFTEQDMEAFMNGELEINL